jgi:hypothetical protein
LMMDEQTLFAFKSLWIPEPEEKRCHVELQYLTEPERSLYQALCDNTFGENVRLEQERINFNYACEKIHSS